MSSPILCRPRSLHPDLWIEAARRATEINPANRPDLARLSRAMPGFAPTPQYIAVVTKKYWGKKGVNLTVGFLDGASTELRKRILLHMNAWAKTANVKFVASQTDPDVRIARLNSPPDDAGYWSYVGTDIRTARRDQPTLNLEGFTMKTSESEFKRVVRHEAGHTLGFEHEHLRAELVDKIDPAKAIAYFKKSDGWSEQETRDQVLTPIKESSLRGTKHADQLSIMCYDIPGDLTFDGKPIIGGNDIDASDYAFIAEIYPKATAKPSKVKAKSRKKKQRAKARRSPARKR
jgi:hypothetical protein